MEVIALFIVVGILILLVILQVEEEKGKEVEEEKGKRKNSNLEMAFFESSEKGICESFQGLMTLIEVLYKKNEKELEVELSNKGFNQLEYIFNDIREQDIKNSKNKINDDKSRLEVELRIKHESIEYNKAISGMKELLDNRQKMFEIIKDGESGYDITIPRGFEAQFDERTDVLLNGDLSPYYGKHNLVENSIQLHP